MGRDKVDTRAVGLDVGLGLVHWLTGADNLHYGLWDDLDVTAENLGQAQVAYTDKLFSYLPDGPLSILDIGGGAGETARKLIALGHKVEIVVPSRILAERCRTNAPAAVVHETPFEAYETTTRFDLCLFSESFQYIPMELALGKARDLLVPDGHILIADCFRSREFAPDRSIRTVGGGHQVARFHDSLPDMGLALRKSEDITDAVAPSIDLERGLLRVFGQAVTRIDDELRAKRPVARRLLALVLKAVLGRRKINRLTARLDGHERTSEVFRESNRYLIALLSKV